MRRGVSNQIVDIFLHTFVINDTSDQRYVMSVVAAVERLWRRHVIDTLGKIL